MHPTDRSRETDAARRARLFELLRQQDRAEAIAARLRDPLPAERSGAAPACAPQADGFGGLRDHAARSWAARLPGQGRSLTTRS